MKFLITVLLLLTTVFSSSFAQVRRGEGGDLPAGAIIAFAGSTCPSGFLSADGSSVSRTTYAKLFAAIGTAHGFASASVFYVPDYRGRFLRGADGSIGRDPDRLTRTAMNTGGATGNVVGSVQDDADQKILGGPISVAGDSFSALAGTEGAFFGTNTSANRSSPGTAGTFVSNMFFDSSRVVRASTEGRPKNAYVNYCIKY
ncbi:hypothetical protein MASR1M48_16300 [Lactococcus petauri]